MKRLPIIFIFFTAFICLNSFGQIPIINGVQPATTYPGNKILITGSGFSSTASQMQVWFDQVKGTITAASEFSIEVIVPSQAKLANIEVLNLVSGLSAKSNLKFMASFGGSGFNPANFAAPVSLLAGNTASINDLCTCDLDLDGKPDVSATQSTGSAMMFFRNTSTPGSLAFAAPISVAIASSTNNTACGDLDGDGRPEVLVSRDGTRNEVWIFKNNSIPGGISMGAPTTSSKLFLDVGQNSFRIAIRDLDADGKPEVIVSNSTLAANNIVYVFLNNWSTKGTISFNPLPIKIVVTGASTTYGMDAQDINGDGKPEIIVNQFNSNGVFILKNTSAAGTVSFASPTKIDVTGSLNHLTTADFNNDGKLDVGVTSNSGTVDNVNVLLNQSTASTISFSSAIKLSAGDSPWGIDASDIDGDGDADIVVANIINAFVSQTKEIVVFLNDGNASFTRSSISGVTIKRSKNIKTGDFDGDGKPDIAYAAINDIAPAVTTNNSIEILRNTNCFVPKILNIGVITICPGQTISLLSIPNAGASFDWKNSANTSLGSTPNLDVTTGDTYTVTATSESGACIKTASVVVNSGAGTVPDPTISANTPVCSGDALNLQTIDDGGSYTYQWTGPNNFAPAASTLAKNQTVSNVTSANAGLYTVQIKNASGCTSNVISKTIDVANLANFVISTSIATNQICQGSTLNLSVNTANGHTYQWIKDGLDLSGSTSSTLIVSLAGVYKVRVTNTTLGCSVETTQVTTSVLTKPISLFTPSAISTCSNQIVTFTNQSTVDPAAAVVYAWDFGDASTSSIASPIHIFTSAATRTVTLTVSYPGVAGCTANSNKSILVSTPTLPIINSTANAICAGETATLSVTGTFVTFNWTGGATTPTLTITQPNTYSVTTTDANGCTATAQKIVSAKTVPSLVVTSSVNGGVVSPVGLQPIRVAVGAIVQLVASGADSYIWTPSDGLTSATIANPVATINADIVYTVNGTLTAGCSAQQAVSFVIDASAGDWLPPNVFSPNGDGNNDLWVIPSIASYSDCTISIFNKQGSKVFEQKGYTNNWDGTYEGQELPQGTYYYVLTCPSGKPVTGNILVAR